MARESQGGVHHKIARRGGGARELATRMTSRQRMQIYKPAK